jgi:hypothetical protein
VKSSDVVLVLVLVLLLLLVMRILLFTSLALYK